MKKLVCAALVAGAMCALADEPAKCEDGSCKSAASAVEAAKPERKTLTAEQRAEMRAKREKMVAERKAAMEAKILEVIKKYVPEEEKAKALLNDLQQAMMPVRRGPGRPLVKKPAAKPAEAAK